MKCLIQCATSHILHAQHDTVRADTIAKESCHIVCLGSLQNGNLLQHFFLPGPASDEFYGGLLSMHATPQNNTKATSAAHIDLSVWISVQHGHLLLGWSHTGMSGRSSCWDLCTVLQCKYVRLYVEIIKGKSYITAITGMSIWLAADCDLLASSNDDYTYQTRTSAYKFIWLVCSHCRQWLDRCLHTSYMNYL